MAYTYDVVFWAWTATGTGATPQAACEAFGSGYAATAGGSSAVSPGTSPWSLDETACIWQGNSYPIDRLGEPDPDPGPDPDPPTALTLAEVQAIAQQNAAAVANLQTQLVEVDPITSELQVEYFGAVVAFLAIIWLGDRIRRFFWREGGDHV